MILVTGATGHLGRLIVDGLLTAGVPAGEVVAGARDPGRLADLAGRGVRVARVDYDDAASLTDALAGVDTLMLVSGSEIGRRVRQHGAIIAAAAAAGVERIAYTSAPHADTSALVLAPEHKATEELLRAAGPAWTILRNNWYSENYAPTFAQARETGVVLTAAGAGRVASAPRSDFAAAAVAVLTTPGHEGRVYELTGDVAWSFDEFAAAAARELGRDVVHRAVSPEELQATLTGAGLDPGTAGFVVALDGNIRDGLLGQATADLSTLIGRPTVPIEETLRTF